MSIRSRYDLMCNRCGFETKGLAEPEYLPEGWGHGDYSRYRNVTTPKDLCPPCFGEYQTWIREKWEQSPSGEWLGWKA